MDLGVRGVSGDNDEGDITLVVRQELKYGMREIKCIMNNNKEQIQNKKVIFVEFLL